MRASQQEAWVTGRTIVSDIKTQSGYFISDCGNLVGGEKPVQQDHGMEKNLHLHSIRHYGPMAKFSSSASTSPNLKGAEEGREAFIFSPSLCLFKP